MILIGMIIKNYCFYVGVGFMILMVIMFCGEVMGESILLMFEVSVMLMIIVLDMFDFEGRFWSMGLMMLKYRIGVVILLINIDVIVVIVMLVMSIVFGLVFVLFSMNVVICLLI